MDKDNRSRNPCKVECLRLRFLDVIQNCKCEILLTADEGKEWVQQQWNVAAAVRPVVSDSIDSGKLQVPNIR